LNQYAEAAQKWAMLLERWKEVTSFQKTMSNDENWYQVVLKIEWRIQSVFTLLLLSSWLLGGMQFTWGFLVENQPWIVKVGWGNSDVGETFFQVLSFLLVLLCGLWLKSLLLLGIPKASKSETWNSQLRRSMSGSQTPTNHSIENTAKVVNPNVTQTEDNRLIERQYGLDKLRIKQFDTDGNKISNKSINPTIESK
jgi:hypothetical protein